MPAIDGADTPTPFVIVMPRARKASNTGWSVPAKLVCSQPSRGACRADAEEGPHPVRIDVRREEGSRDPFEIRCDHPLLTHQPHDLDGGIGGDDAVAALVPEGVGAEQDGAGHSERR